MKSTRSFVDGAVAGRGLNFDASLTLKWNAGVIAGWLAGVLTPAFPVRTGSRLIGIDDRIIQNDDQRIAIHEKSHPDR